MLIKVSVYGYIYNIYWLSATDVRCGIVSFEEV